MIRARPFPRRLYQPSILPVSPIYCLHKKILCANAVTWDKYNEKFLNIETGDPPGGWGVRRTISNKEFRTAEVHKKIRECFSLRHSAVLRFILSTTWLLIVACRALTGETRFCSPFQGQIKAGSSGLGCFTARVVLW